MNREIKFRGKRLDNGKWWYGSLVILNGRYFIFNDEGRYEVSGATVGQYTGMKDNTDKEIYEEDVLREVETERDVAIEWDEWAYVYTHNDFGYVWPNHTENFVVIGNIHDNPELLNQ